MRTHLDWVNSVRDTMGLQPLKKDDTDKKAELELQKKSKLLKREKEIGDSLRKEIKRYRKQERDLKKHG